MRTQGQTCLEPFLPRQDFDRCKIFGPTIRKDAQKGWSCGVPVQRGESAPAAFKDQMHQVDPDPALKRRGCESVLTISCSSEVGRVRGSRLVQPQSTHTVRRANRADVHHGAQTETSRGKRQVWPCEQEVPWRDIFHNNLKLFSREYCTTIYP